MSGNLLNASIIVLWVYFCFSFVGTIVPASSIVPVLSWEFVTGSFLLGSFILVLQIRTPDKSRDKNCTGSAT